MLPFITFCRKKVCAFSRQKTNLASQPASNSARQQSKSHIWVKIFLEYYLIRKLYDCSLKDFNILIELVSKELNHLAAILHVYARGFDFYEGFFFQKEKGNTFTLLIIFIVKSLQKEQNSTNLLL